MKKWDLGEVEGLKQELRDLGYYQFQIDSLVREEVHTTQLEKLSAAKLVQLATALERQLSFARRCKVITNNPLDPMELKRNLITSQVNQIVINVNKKDMVEIKVLL